MHTCLCLRKCFLPILGEGGVGRWGGGLCQDLHSSAPCPSLREAGGGDREDQGGGGVW